ncbi:MAG TPA: OmpA family protein [Kofleriaceae bacterium]|nr:OmpA family protein [Kofleriaceae bacterium]
MSGNKREMSESGMLVYPKLPVPKPGREGEAKGKRGGGRGKLVFVLVLVALVAGAAGGFYARPFVLDDPRVAEAEQALAKERLATVESRAQLAKLQVDAQKLDEQRALLNEQLEAAKPAQDMLASKQAAATKAAADLEATKKKLAATNAGTVTIVGREVHLAIADKALFKAGDELSAGGLKALDRVAAALKDLGDMQVTVAGHTDDQPPPSPVAPKPPKAKAADKKPAPPVPAAPTFATNWELSSARALAVVHYLQDTHKLDAARLAALAFAQYRPVSKTNRAANRRIEIVVSSTAATK